MSIILLTGAVDTIVFKIQDDTVVGTKSDGSPRKFMHPYVQCFLMSVGEMLCLVYVWFKECVYGNQYPIKINFN